MTIERRSLARFAPVDFDERGDRAGRGGRAARTACRRGACRRAPVTTRRCWRGCARRAWCSSRACAGISHNPAELTDDADLEAGANVLLHVLLRLAARDDEPRRSPSPPRRWARSRAPTAARRVVERLIAMLRDAAGRGARARRVPRARAHDLLPALGSLRRRAARRSSSGRCRAPTTQPLFDEARRLGVGFHLGYAELTPDGHRYNTAILVERDGRVVAKYRKVHLPGHEEPEPWRPFQHLERQYFEPGPGGVPRCTARSAGIVGIAICNDRRWPETYRVLGLQGVELICIGYNTPIHYAPDPGAGSSRRVPQQSRDGRRRLPERHVGRRRREGRSRGGRRGPVARARSSRPSGEVVARATTAADEVIVATCDLDLVPRLQAHGVRLRALPAPGDVRPDRRGQPPVVRDASDI